MKLMPESRHRSIFGYLLVSAVLALGIFCALHGVLAQNMIDTHLLQVLAQLKVLNLTVNNGSPINLTANATTAVAVSFTVTGANGCGPVFYGGNVTATLFLGGVSSSFATACATSSPATSTRSLFGCYVVGTTTNNCPSANSSATANATATFSVWYFAKPTDASSTLYNGWNWGAFVGIVDSSGTTGFATSSGVRMNSLTAIALTTTTLNYGTVVAGADTSSTAQTTTIWNAGNTSTTLSVNGTALVSGANAMPTSSQHYATSTFTYGGSEQSLSSTALAVSGWLWNPAWVVSWATTTSYIASTAYSAGASANGYVYVSGGSISSPTNTVRFAKPSANGTISAWSSTQSLPTSLMGHGMVVMNGYAYIIGGDSTGGSATLTTTVLYAPISATGSIGTWATTTPMPTARAYSPIASYNGYIYAIGGLTCCYGADNAVFFAQPNSSTGQISNWTSTTVLPYSIYEGLAGEAAAYGGRVYVIGGQTDGGGTLSNAVYSAPISATGSLGSWTSTVSYPFAMTGMSVFIDNGLIYGVGGWNGSAATSVVYMAALLNSSTIDGSWNQVSSLPAVRENHAIAATNYSVYVVTGDNGSTNQSTVYFAPIRNKDLFWGLGVPSSTAGGAYSSTITYTAGYSP